MKMDSRSFAELNIAMLNTSVLQRLPSRDTASFDNGASCSSGASALRIPIHTKVDAGATPGRTVGWTSRSATNSWYSPKSECTPTAMLRLYFSTLAKW